MKDNGGGSDVPAKKKKSSVPPHRRYMGISMLAITEQIIDELRVKLHIPAQITHGVVVFKILDGSPADRAGVEPGNCQPLSNFLLKKMYYCFFCNDFFLKEYVFTQFKNMSIITTLSL